MAADTQKIIAGLAAAFPNAKLHRETIAIYVRMLDDIPPEELAPVAHAYMLEAEWFPTVRDLRRAVVERRLQLPSGETAWEQALEWAQTRATIRCTTCDGHGVLPGGDPVELDRGQLDQIQDDYLRGILERVIKASGEPTHLCDTCGGSGDSPNPDRLQLQTPVRRALEHVGGATGVAASENLGILRAQFLKAYAHVREDALRTENLGSAGIALTASDQPMIEGSTAT